jgi:hypothetical protein
MPSKNVALTAYKAGVKARKQGKYHRPKATLSLAIIAGFLPTAAFAWEGMGAGGIAEVGHRLTGRLTGYDTGVHKWSLQELGKGWVPIIGGVVAHKLANKFGINRMIARAGIPLLRI